MVGSLFGYKTMQQTPLHFQLKTAEGPQMGCTVLYLYLGGWGSGVGVLDLASTQRPALPRSSSEHTSCSWIDGHIATMMDLGLLEAATDDNAPEMERLAGANPAVLLGTTRQGNNILHIAATCGHKVFCTKFLEQIKSLHPHSLSKLLCSTNKDGETPLLAAVKSSRASLARDLLLNEYRTNDPHLNEALLKQDRHGCNVLHHAIRNGDEALALQLIEVQPALSSYMNRRKESPMFIAVLRGFSKVYLKLMDTQGSIYDGTNSSNALHAAVKYGHKDFAIKLVEDHPTVAKRLATEEDVCKDTPMHLAAHYNRVEILEVMLKFDQSLGYTISSNSALPPIFLAANRGHVDFARALLKYCPDTPYCNSIGETCLHEAVSNNRMEFVKFILEKCCKLRKLVNLQDDKGETALHLAVKKCNPEMVRALLKHPDIDTTVINDGHNFAAIWKLLNDSNIYAKTINWNKISWLMLNADSRAETDIYNLHEEIKNNILEESRKDVKYLTETYTGNTSLVAVLIATITFAAAFTLPGGYSSDAESEGLPIMARKLAFQAFLIFDTLGMCSSLAVAFICVLAKWMDFEFLVHYRSLTKKLMWFAYMTTTLAFATGLYTVLAPRVHWLAIVICVLSVSLPILVTLFGERPIIMLKIRIIMLKIRNRKPFDSNFLDMV